MIENELVGFEIARACDYYCYLSLFFIENEHKIYLCKPFQLSIEGKSKINISELIKILKTLKLEENLTLEVISEASKL
jgi:hypothetical protein